MQDATAATRAYGEEAQKTYRLVADEQRRAGDASRSFSSSLASAFSGALTQGKSLSSVMQGLASDISRLALNSALKGFTSGLTGSLSGVAANVVASADGNVFSGGRVRPFAQGGVVNSPMLFPLRGGMGLAGEAGAEAILPLTRGSDGRLGVASQGGMAAPQIIFNVTATDADSFRRSEGQMAAMLSRLSGRGARNL
ncbi:MAG: phage tail tape measure protein [Parvibaculaceae bacterium]|nr:phage tail tape measure protein [Parvibaculaceae bacterium]